MAQNYSGNTTGITGHPTVTISEPVGTDVRNAASVQTPLRRLADFLQYVASQFALTSEVTADIATHNGVTNPHSATSAATASRMVLRDAAGRAQVADPSVAADIATKGYVDDGTAWASGTGATWGSGWTPNSGGFWRRWASTSGVGVVFLSAVATVSGTGTTVLTLPLYSRPGNPLPCQVIDFTAGTVCAAYIAGGVLTLAQPAVSGHQYYITAMFVAHA